jgi:hypothetical protein
MTRLHRDAHLPGVYRVGASPLTIRRFIEGKNVSWDIYGDTLEGLCRIPGKWSFPKLAEARERAFEYARQRGWAD